MASVSSEDPKTGGPGGLAGTDEEGAQAEGLAPAPARSPSPRETQPLFLSEYWQRYSSTAKPTEVRAEEPEEPRQGSSTELEILDLESLDDVEPESGRDPIPSVMVGLSEFDEPLPSLPGGVGLPDEMTPAPEVEEAEETEGPNLDHRRTSKFLALTAEPPGEFGEDPEALVESPVGFDEEDESLTEPPEALGGREEALAPTHSAEVLAAAVRALEEQSEDDEEDEIDVNKTQQFKSMVLADDLDTSIWDFSDEALKRRNTEAGGVIIADRYRIIEPLATGGMARIFRVQHLNLGKEFALKIIHDDLSTDVNMRKAFIREARVSSLLNHPNIVQVTDFGVDDRHGAYLVLEILKGETLFDRLERDGHLRLPLALDIALQVAEALHYMHGQNIIHCDIKPENIFLSEPPRERRRRVVVKLIDFGLSRREALGAQLASSEVGGTPHFMAPEQIRGSAPQPSMDIYSLGILLFEMVVGDLPFDGDLNAILSAQLHDAPPTPSKLTEEPLDEYVDQLILKALAKEPADRQPSMGQMIFEIRTVMEMLGFRSRRGRSEKKRPSMQEEADIEARLSVFENCPCPLFRIDTEPKILVANQAFHSFVAGKKGENLVGKPLDTTRLGQFYPNLRMDVLAAALDKAPIQRVFTFRKDETRMVSVMVWLVPEVDESTGSTTFLGMIVPLGALQNG